MSPLTRVAERIIELAELAACAVRVDHHLLRHQRVTFLPGTGPDLEADLWFSPIARLGGPSGFTFESDLAAELRRRLVTRNPQRFERAWIELQRCHAGLDPALRLEEELAYCQAVAEHAAEAKAREQAEERIRVILRSAVADLAQRGHRGLSYWAARALPRFSVSLHELRETKLLEASVALDLERRVSDSGLSSQDIAAVASRALPRRPLAVERHDGSLRFGDPSLLPSAPTLEVPDTRPIVLELWQDDVLDRTLPPIETTARTWSDHGQTILGVPSGRITLRTILGESYDLEDLESWSPSAEWPIIDFSSELERHRDFVGELPLDPHSLPDGRQWVIGRGGTGKSAILAQCLERVESSGWIVAHHFFRRGVPQWENVEDAVRSLSGQIERQRPELAGEETSPLLRLAALLQRFSQRRDTSDRLLLVLDGLDDAVSSRGASLERLISLELPDGVVALLSSRTRPLRDDRVLDLEDGSLVEKRRWAIVDRVTSGVARYSAVPAFESAETDEWPPERVAGVCGDDWTFSQILLDAGKLQAERGSLPELPRLEPGDLAGLVRWWKSLTASEAPGLDDLLSALASLREAIPKEVLRGLLARFKSEDAAPHAFELAAPFLDSIGDRWIIRSEELREAVQREADEEVFQSSSAPLGQRGHRLLLEGPARWPAAPDADEWTRRYAIGYALHHRLESDPASASELLQDFDYWTARLARGDVDGFLEDLGRARLEPPLGPELVDALRDERERVAGEPLTSADLILGALQRRGLSRERLRELFGDSLPHDRPRLRVRQEVAVRGARRREIDAGIPRGALWASEDTLLIWMAEGRLLSLREDEVQASAVHEGGIRRAVLIPQLPAVATGGDDHTVRLWSWPALELRNVLVGHEGPVLGLRFIARGSKVVSWSADRTIRCWHGETLAAPAVLRGHVDRITSVVVSDDEQRLVSVSLDGTIRAWRLDRPDEAFFIGRAEGVSLHGVELDADGEVAAVACADGTLRLWSLEPGVDPASAVPKATWRVHRSATHGIVSAPGDRLLASWSVEGEIRVGTWAGEEVARFMAHEGEITACEFLDDVRLVTAGADGTMALWHAPSGHRIRRFFGHEDRIEGVSSKASPDRIVSWSDDRTVRVWNIENGVATHRYGARPVQARTLFAAQNPPRLIWVRDQRVTRVDPKSGRTRSLRRKQVLEGSTRTLREDGRTLLVVGAGLLVCHRLSDREGESLGRGWRHKPKVPVVGAALSSSGKWIVSWDREHRLHVHEPRGGRVLRTLQGHTQRISSCAVADDGRGLSVSWDGTARLWDLDTGALLVERVNPAGERMLGGQIDLEHGVARTWTATRMTIWSLRTGDSPLDRELDDRLTVLLPGDKALSYLLGTEAGFVHAFGLRRHPPITIHAHAGPVTALLDLDDRGYIVSGSQAGDLRVWNAGDAALLGVLWLGGGVTSLARVGDVIAAEDSTGKLWLLKAFDDEIVEQKVVGAEQSTESESEDRGSTAAAEVSLSFGREEAPQAAALAELLESSGIAVAKNQDAEPHPRLMSGAIQSSTLFIAMLGEKVSPWVRRETAYALSLEREHGHPRVLSVLIPPADPKTLENVALELVERQAFLLDSDERLPELIGLIERELAGNA